MKEKIAEIVEQLCIVCPSEITCGFDAREKATQAILALIAEEQQPMIPYEKVSKELNRRVMLGATQIGIIADGGEVLQSENKNVITISHKGFYYHINLTELVPTILDWEVIEVESSREIERIMQEKPIDRRNEVKKGKEGGSHE